MLIPALLPRSPGHQFVLYADACSGVPGAQHERTFAEVNAVLARPDVAERLIASGSGEPSIMALADFTAMIRSDYEKYGKVIKAIGLKVDD